MFFFVFQDFFSWFISISIIIFLWMHRSFFTSHVLKSIFMFSTILFINVHSFLLHLWMCRIFFARIDKLFLHSFSFLINVINMSLVFPFSCKLSFSMSCFKSFWHVWSSSTSFLEFTCSKSSFLFSKKCIVASHYFISFIISFSRLCSTSSSL